jgi:hypothetical protein
MTDTELVEAVAKEILEWENPMIEGDIAYIALTDNVFNNLWKSFNPFHNLNDLQLVKNKFERWNIHKDWDGFQVVIEQGNAMYVADADNEIRAWLEAALTAKKEGEMTDDKLLYEPHCCEGWSSYESEVNGKCPDCGMPIVDGHAAYGCYYSPVTCETCGQRTCDGSC